MKSSNTEKTLIISILAVTAIASTVMLTTDVLGKQSPVSWSQYTTEELSAMLVAETNAAPVTATLPATNTVTTAPKPAAQNRGFWPALGAAARKTIIWATTQFRSAASIVACTFSAD